MRVRVLGLSITVQLAQLGLPGQSPLAQTSPIGKLLRKFVLPFKVSKFESTGCTYKTDKEHCTH